MGALPKIRRILTRGSHTILDLSESANLYLTPSQGEMYEAVVSDESYRESIVSHLTGGAKMLPHLLSSMALDEEKPLTVIDCGPATAEESIRRLHSLVGAISVARYVIIDVNSRFLSKVKAGVVRSLAVPVTTLQHRFEDLNASILRQYITGEALLIFGSTGMNYESTELVRLLRKLCFSGLFVSLESLLHNEELSTRGYESNAVIEFAFGPLFLLGASREQFEFQALLNKDRVLLEFIAKHRTRLSHPEAPILQPGDRVWTAFSRRLTLDDHQQEVQRILGKKFNTFILQDQVAASLGCFL